ncbi:12107_t:CDS:2 [Cetraspora pellucida]|uniref:12107_t:CDS:1 n=1 Tax=Cetraspora pellucida TaxID=1433469 RepID=A0A9N9BJ06_9GLOM|nr:12107_t:CDS:2 [Cetraspora pellucida]
MSCPISSLVLNSPNENDVSNEPTNNRSSLNEENISGSKKSKKRTLSIYDYLKINENGTHTTAINLYSNIQITEDLALSTSSSSCTAILTTIPIKEEIRNNATAQKQIASSKEIAKKKLKKVVRYDKSGRPSFLLQHLDLLEHIHDSVEYELADARRPVAGVLRDKTKYHPDGHYCLASVKGARQFAQTFAEFSVIISQDDKAKISLGIAAIGRTFHILQSSSQPVQIPNHDFVHGSNQKLIPSVYLIIKPSEANDNLRTRQVAIFVWPQWSIGTSSITHMEDLTCLVLDNQYSEALKVNGDIKPIWILLVDDGPDENPRHLKNIESYCKIFKKFDLDYLSIRTHAPGQSKYNPVEKGIATLSSKLAGVVLPIDHFGKHFDSQGRVINNELANKNFHYAGSMLSDIWSRDPIFGKYVKTTYVDKITNPFVNIYFELFKVPKYDAHCPSIDQTTYSRLCCLICHKYFSTLSYVAKHKCLQHLSTHGRPKKKPKNSESIAEFVLITNSATMEDLNLPFLQQNENEFFNECRKCFSDIE